MLLLLKKIQSNYSDYNYSRYYNSRMAYSQIFSQIRELNDKDTKLVLDYYDKNKGKNEEELCNEHMNSKFKYPFDISIIKYNSENVSPDNFRSSYRNLNNSRFFTSLFRNINIKLEDIEKAYKEFEKHTQKRLLTNIEETINKELLKISNQFNDLYYSHNEPYLFSINLGEENIYFEMARGKDKDALPIEYQSDGFRWFFNFFFNFIYLEKIKAGDIILMDEPGTHLPPYGQKELREFIKRFAKDNDLTFIIATQSPFLISVDDFDELRVVSMENNISVIDNSFHAINPDDPDTLASIKKSLTIEQNVLYDLDTEVIWVEGITDYCYLTMFKKMLDIKGISFIPFNGVGKNEKHQNYIIRELNKIKFHKRNILVDGDKNGLKMKENCKETCFNNIKVISDLNTEDKKFTNIESLFSAEDIKKHPEILEKTSFYAAKLKNTTNANDFNEETKENFKNLFNLLLN